MANYVYRYRPQLMGVNSTYPIPEGVTEIGGFLPKTAGTITVVDNQGNTIVDAIPLTAGVFLSLPIYLQNGSSGSVTLAGGASGTLLT